jgi:hypothetical protein
MRALRSLAGALLWLVACVLGLVGVILCVTILLIPLGLLVLRLSRDLFAKAVRLMLPRALAHPVEELDRRTSGRRRTSRTLKSATHQAASTSRRSAKRARKTLSSAR